MYDLPGLRKLNRVFAKAHRRRLNGYLAAFAFDIGLDLGSGPSPRNLFGSAKIYGVDFVANETAGVFAADLALQPIPAEDSTIDIVTAYDFLEHIPRWANHDGRSVFPFINLMNEIFRVLKPGGFFLSETPGFPMKDAFKDPTHVNFITQETFSQYFSGDCWAEIYGFRGTFEAKEIFWDGAHLIALLRKPDLLESADGAT